MREELLAKAERLLDSAKREPGHSTVEDDLIDAIECLIEILKMEGKP